MEFANARGALGRDVDSDDKATYAELTKGCLFNGHPFQLASRHKGVKLGRRRQLARARRRSEGDASDGAHDDARIFSGEQTAAMYSTRSTAVLSRLRRVYGKRYGRSQLVSASAGRAENQSVRPWHSRSKQSKQGRRARRGVRSRAGKAKQESKTGQGRQTDKRAIS